MKYLFATSALLLLLLHVEGCKTMKSDVERTSQEVRTLKSWEWVLLDSTSGEVYNLDEIGRGYFLGSKDKIKIGEVDSFNIGNQLFLVHFYGLGFGWIRLAVFIYKQVPGGWKPILYTISNRWENDIIINVDYPTRNVKFEKEKKVIGLLPFDLLSISIGGQSSDKRSDFVNRVTRNSGNLRFFTE